MYGVVRPYMKWQPVDEEFWPGFRGGVKSGHRVIKLLLINACSVSAPNYIDPARIYRYSIVLPLLPVLLIHPIY